MTRSVRDIMHPGLLTCEPDSSLGRVATLLAQHHIHALLVAENDSQPLGIISDFDLLAGEWLSVDVESLEAMRKITARDLMTVPIDSIEANSPVADAVHMMMEKQIHRILVTENSAPVGVISVSDLVASLAQQLKAERGTVGDVMSDAFLVCRDKTPVASIARTMTETHFRSVVVVDAKGKPKGVVTGKDLLGLAEKELDENLTVREVMNLSLITVGINASLHEAADLMIQNHMHRLIVADGNDPESFPLGIISSFDIVAEMARPGSIWQS